MNRSINLSRVAIITGGGRGMGRAMAIGLAKAGNHVIITAARECAEIDSVAHQAAEACGDSRVLPIVADVTIDEDCRRVIDTAMKRFGRLDILVNNAARGMKYVSRSFMTEAPRFWTTDPLVWRMVIDTNVNGPYLMARHAVPAMLQRGGGLLTVWAFQSRARLRNRYMGSGSRRYWNHGERDSAWGRHPYWDDPR